MPDKARYATVHRLCFREVKTAEMLDLSRPPSAAMAWKIGPSGPVGPDGIRLPTEIWCAIGLYRSETDAREALQARETFMPFLSQAAESWHALLLPMMHKGVCNYLDSAQPGTLFEVGSDDPGGVCMAITTAGFVIGPELDMGRVLAFRRNVDATGPWMAQAGGCSAALVFAPHVRGEDGCTWSLWRDDASMLKAAYHPGMHREHLDRHKKENSFDRSSFTRCRVLDSVGRWGGRDPLQF